MKQAECGGVLADCCVVRVVDAPQVGLVQRHLVVPLVVVPFLFIFPVQTGHRGWFLLTEKTPPQWLSTVVV